MHLFFRCRIPSLDAERPHIVIASKPTAPLVSIRPTSVECDHRERIETLPDTQPAYAAQYKMTRYVISRSKHAYLYIHLLDTACQRRGNLLATRFDSSRSVKVTNTTFTFDRILVNWQAGIDFLSPGVDAPFEVLHFSEACADQQFQGTRRAGPGLAQHDHLFGAVQFG
jgi:hypothetical protein